MKLTYFFLILLNTEYKINLIWQDLQRKQILRNCYGDSQKHKEGRKGLVGIQLEDGGHFLARPRRLWVVERLCEGETQLFIPPANRRQDGFQGFTSQGFGAAVKLVIIPSTPFVVCGLLCCTIIPPLERASLHKTLCIRTYDMEVSFTTSFGGLWLCFDPTPASQSHVKLRVGCIKKSWQEINWSLDTQLMIPHATTDMVKIK